MNLFNKKISEVFRNYFKKSEGDIGLEIEVEGENLLAAVQKFWVCHREQSLRGESMEYVFSKPLPIEAVRKALEYLEGALRANNSKLTFSNRTSVHVHVNVQDLTTLQAYNFVVLYLIFENILVNYAGPSRVGNLFCLRGVDAEALIKKLVFSIENKLGFLAFEGDGYRYAALNLCAVAKFGSFEFRALRGTMHLPTIELWTQTLFNLREKAKEFENPKSIIAAFSAKGPVNFLKEIISEEFIRDQKETFIDDLYDGVRLIQDFAYCSDWVAPKEPVFKEAKDKIKNKFGVEIPVRGRPVPNFINDAFDRDEEDIDEEDIDEEDIDEEDIDEEDIAAFVPDEEDIDEEVEAPRILPREREIKIVAGREFAWFDNRWNMV